MFKKIAVALDESPEAERALRSALDLAKFISAEVNVITVIESLPAYIGYVSAVAPEVPGLLRDERQAFYEDLHGRAKKAAEEAGVRLRTTLVEGDEVKSLLEAIDQITPELLVVGLRREPGGLSRVIGGTAHQLALHAKCHVLGIR